MAHHGTYAETQEMRSQMNRLLGAPEDTGATGRYPNGKLSDGDEGEIKVAVAADPKNRVVLIDFGKPVSWIGFTPEQASEIADLLTKKAWECRGIS